ncbi:MAG TPA: DUF2834 domain-containing protein [Candidatus Limnocylindrales bacterium]|nr:DUF2834 domain-containing protein [Candidatus Limnocylindrales bacterium]
MTGLLIHAVIGLGTVAIFFWANAYLYRRDWPGSSMSPLEALCYVLAIGSVVAGWYFNTKYMFTYPAEGSWVHFTKMLFDNPAAGSVGQDIIITNAILFPIWTIVDGSRHGLRHTWIYVTMSMFTSFGFAMGLYLAAQERQVRWLARPQ